MEKVEVIEVMKVTEEVESCYSQMEVTTPKKRKSKAHEDSVEKPKKPRSAYLLYYFDVHQSMQQEIPNLPQSEINKRISESWRRLSVAEKAFYLEKAKSEKEGIGTSPSPSKELPGFRKILPRASYFVMPKGCSSNTQPGDTQPEVSAESFDCPMEGGLSSVSLPHEPQYTALGLASEVELSEQPIVAEDIAGEMTVASQPSSFTVSSKPLVCTDAHVSHISAADLMANGLTLKGNKAGGGYSGAMVQQIKGGTTQVVAVIPNQNLLEPKSMAAVRPVGPVMMVSVGANIDRSAKPSYKMPAKTYTRRGRGRCLNPGCAFVYVTRHKPPTCPECGSHLGGKWIPAAKKEAASKQSPWNAETKHNESRQPTTPTSLEGNADLSKTNTTGSRKEGQVQRSPRKQPVVHVGEPPEGSTTKEQDQTKQLNDSLKVTAVQVQDISNAAVQKRPVRPILPAYYSTGRALFQIITVPSDKGKCQSANDNKSSTVPQESFTGLKPSTLKQLGQVVPTTAIKRVKLTHTNS